MQLPSKSQKGARIRDWLVETVDRLIDCVASLRLIEGPGIRLKETPGGTIISVCEQNTQPRMSAPAAMVAAGKNMRIDNGTASSVYVPGGTASNVPILGATFTCTVPDGMSGGGDVSGFIPNWSHGGHSGVIPPDSGNSLPYKATEDGYVFAWASFDPFRDGLRYRNYAAHVSINDGWMKVAELKLPNETFFVVANGIRYTRDPAKDYSGKILVEVYDETPGEWVKKTYSRNNTNDFYDSDNDEYSFFAWGCNDAPSGYECLYTKKWDVRGGEVVYMLDDSGDNPEFTSIGDCEFYPDYSYFAWASGNSIVYTQSGSVSTESLVYTANERGQFESAYTVAETNANFYVVAIGAGIPIPYRSGASIRFIVTADGVPYGTNVNYSAPVSAPAVCCLVYEKNAQNGSVTS